MLRPRVIGIALAVATALTLVRSAAAKPYTLAELIEMARRGNPGVQASAAAATAMESQVTEAKRNWFPSGELISFLAPVPEVHCLGANQLSPNPDGTRPTQGVQNLAESNCTTTDANPHDNPSILTDLKGPWFRTDIKIVQPLWDFGKISAGVSAAEAGVSALRQKQVATASEVELNVSKAYWGIKLARELLDALAEGSGYVDEAQKKIEKELADGSGSATITDRLRLRTVRAEVDAQTLEAKRLADLALAGLRTLLGSEAPAELEIDDAPFEPRTIPSRPIASYEEAALLNRPEVRALGFAVKSKHALADLERRREYPDLALVATGSFAWAPTIDIPKNAFYNNPFNTYGAGIAATLRVPLDIGPKLARADRVRGEAEEAELRRREALGGIALEVRKAHNEMTEAAARVEAVHKGEKAGKAWVTAVAQNFAIGIAEARDFSDALNSFFLMRARYLQAIYDLNVAAAALSRATGAPL